MDVNHSPRRSSRTITKAFSTTTDELNKEKTKTIDKAASVRQI